MPVALLDINVLLALAWPTHVHHEAAHRWFSTNRHNGWATCPHTQLGFLRLSIQPAVVKVGITFADALNVLTASTEASGHHFWPLDYAMTDILPVIKNRIVGPLQLADALLIDLAIRRFGRLATFDRRLTRLVPEDSSYLKALELIPA